MFKQVFPLESIRHLNEKYFLLGIDLGEAASDLQPGQFFELKRPDCPHPLLHKPFSIYDVQSGKVYFMIKRLGHATEQFAQMHSGNLLDLIGPLGNAFPFPQGEKALLVSGGSGYPPLFFLQKKLLSAGKKVHWLHGGRGKDDVFSADKIWTEDGSAGNLGYVTDGLLDYLKTDSADVIYACGPKPMLKTCAQIASERNLPLYVSLEAYMACGVGVCHGCAVQVKTDTDIGITYQTVCQDGPVFNAKELVWDAV